MKNILKRYKVFLLLVCVSILLMLIIPDIGYKSVDITVHNFMEMILFLPPIFILLGLLDVWVERETMIKMLGENSGVLGILIAFFLGSAAAGPLYTAFPVAGVLLKKGSNLFNVFIFLGAWSTTKIPLLLFEASALGTDFMLLRLALNIPGIMVIAYFTEKLITGKEKEAIYQKSYNL